jgi:hypothetical protein
MARPPLRKGASTQTQRQVKHAFESLLIMANLSSAEGNARLTQVAGVATTTIPERLPERSKWFLGFDCATKTFAFSLSYVDLDAFASSKARLRVQANASLELLRRASALAANGHLQAAKQIVDSVSQTTAAIAAETNSYLRLLDGETADLFPGIPDKNVPTVARIQAIVRYVAQRVRPAMERLGIVAPRVVVEFQMGPNAAARTVAAALITLFATDDVIIVGPSLKNKIAVCEEGRYAHFAKRYSSSYSANKAHAIYNFGQIEATFGSDIPTTKPASLRGHIADSFMQVLGHLVHGSEEKAAEMF